MNELCESCAKMTQKGIIKKNVFICVEKLKVKFMKKKYWTIAIFIAVLIFIFINTFIHSFNENNKEYNFVITKTETTPTSTLIFYDKEK